MKVILNKCYGGPCFSDILANKLNINAWEVEDHRFNPAAIAGVEEMGKAASGICSNLVVKEIPDDYTDYTIMDYDGIETLLYVLNGKLKYA